MYYNRYIEKTVLKSLSANPVTAILGPRQCGKSTLENSLLGIKTFEQLAGHPSFGAIWESVVLANLTGHFPECECHFYRTNHGSEIDFMLEYKGKTIAVECKNTLSPSLTKGTWQGLEDLKPERTLIVAPVKDSWSVKEGVEVTSISGAISKVSETFFS